MLRLRSLAGALALLALPASAAAQAQEAPPAQPPPAQPPPAQLPPVQPPAAQPAPPASPAPAPPLPGAYPQQPGAYPQPPPGAYPQQPGAYPQQPGAYPQQQPGAYPQQPGAYPQQQPGAYPQQPGAYPQPPGAYPQQPPGYGQPPPGYGYDPYGQPGYYAPQAPSPPPAPPKPLRWSLRFDPFELVMRRLSFQAEVAVVGPLALEIVPAWIFGSPYSGIDMKGFSIGGNAVFYLSGQAFRGMWLKAHFTYENFSATYANPYDPTLVGTPQRLGSAILGAMFGDTFVVPRSGGFALSGGIGIGVATANKTDLTAPGDIPRRIPTASATLYDGFDRVRILGTLGLGVAF
jgi:hypothetical protein